MAASPKQTHKSKSDDKFQGASSDIDPEEYSLRKRLPRKLPKRKNDIYINRKTDFHSQFARAQRLLESGYNDVYIHGLGAAVNRAINLGLQLQKKGLGTLEVAVNTTTVELVDDFEPERDDLEPITHTRNNSAVHIKVFRPDHASTASGEVNKQQKMDTGS